MAKRQPHMSAAPAYIVYGHRHAVRLVTRLIAIGLLLAAIVTVSSASSGSAAPGKPSRRPPPARTAAARRPCATVHHARNGTSRARRREQAAGQDAAARRSPRATSRPSRSRRTRKIPVMVLNSNGIHGVAHQLAARGAGRRLSDHLRRQRAEARPADDRAVRQGLRARPRASSRGWSATCSS